MEKKKERMENNRMVRKNRILRKKLIQYFIKEKLFFIN